MNEKQKIVIHICKPHKPAHEPKLAKEYAFPNAQTQRHSSTDKPRPKEGQLVTAPTQKAGFRVPKTVLWLIKH
jgi:hypothetical protein